MQCLFERVYDPLERATHPIDLDVATAAQPMLVTHYSTARSVYRP
jgi:hypothetical protein